MYQKRDERTKGRPNRACFKASESPSPLAKLVALRDAPPLAGLLDLRGRQERGCLALSDRLVVFGREHRAPLNQVQSARARALGIYPDPGRRRRPELILLRWGGDRLGSCRLPARVRAARARDARPARRGPRRAQLRRHHVGGVARSPTLPHHRFQARSIVEIGNRAASSVSASSNVSTGPRSAAWYCASALRQA